MKRFRHHAARMLVAATICSAVFTQSASAAGTANPPALAPSEVATNDPAVLVKEQKLPANGTLILDMNVGDLKIVAGSQADQLRLEIRADSSYDEKTVASWVKRFDVAADRASIEIESPRHDHCTNCGSAHVTIYIPAQTALKVKLEVGNLNIQRVRGNKEVAVRIGDLRIGYNSMQEYAHIETTTHIGGVEDPLHAGNSHGFLGASEDFTRSGQYHLRASVWIGDLSLYEEGKS